MNKLIYMIFISIFFSSCALSFDNSLLLTSTRVIYNESDEKGVVFNVTNNGEVPFLLQSRIMKNNQDLKNEIPFIITPPLKRLDPQESVLLRIIYVDGDLPHDKESVFNLVLKQIPSQELSESGLSSKPKITIATQNIIKLFYRPLKIEKLDANKEKEKIFVKNNNNYLEVNNPTPFWITFDSISIDKNSIDIDEMISPFGQSSFPLNKITGESLIEWKTIDDNGYPSIIMMERIK